MAGKKTTQAPAPSAATTPPEPATRKRWTKLTPRDHVLKQIEIQRELGKRPVLAACTSLG